MRTFSQPPTAKLSPYVDRFWGWEAGDGEIVRLPTVLPGTGAEVFFHYRTPFRTVDGRAAFPFEDTHLLYVRRHPVELAPAGGLGFIAIRFRAGALHHFTRLSGNELIDQQPRAVDLWGRAAKELVALVLSAPSNRARVQLLEMFLIRQLDKHSPDHLVMAAASQLYRHCADLSILRLAAHLGIGKRQLERRFLQVTGQTLVEVKRLGRFQKTARALVLDPSAAFADSALAQGYYDQSHFIHEFKSLTSLSPLSYLKQVRLKTHFYNPPRLGSGRIDTELHSC